MIVSLHLPKSGGSSFRRTLQDHFGPRLKLDYADRPLHASLTGQYLTAATGCLRCLGWKWRPATQGFDCVHGHFFALKYRCCASKAQPRQLVTWLRDPVERLASHYYYWKNHPEEGPLPPLRQRLLDEEWSLSRFCLEPELRNLYAKFLWGTPLERFSYVGISEYYDEDLRVFARRFLGQPLVAYHENQNRIKSGERYIPAGRLRTKIEQYHGKDLAIYRQALAMRQARDPIA